MAFYPKSGWTNDPNGLIVIDGTYHMFFQYYPDDIKWGPMHWGHAISQDGVNWEELPVAIYPNEMGYIFSGSSILDIENISGFGSENTPALLCFYTEHNPHTGEQQQCIAYSTDYIKFEKYDGNPVIRNTISDTDFKKDFRDPKVFKNTIMGGYSMVLAAGERLEFFHTKNLISWDYTGSIDIAKYLGKGICECPDCFELDGKWVMSLSYIPLSTPEDEVENFTDRHTMNYFVGQFDGKSFVPDEHENGRKYLDYGPDNYAMVSFSNLQEVLLMGWAENWDYVYDIPANGTRGKMTEIRKASLIDSFCGKMLKQEFLIESRALTVTNGSEVSLELSNGNRISIFADNKELVVTRNNIPGTDDSRWLSKTGFNRFVAPRVFEGDCHLEMIMHESYLEILADKGCISVTVKV